MYSVSRGTKLLGSRTLNFASAQGDHSPGKHGKVRELDSGQGKWKKSGKVIITILQLHERKILPHFEDIKAGILVCKIMIITIVMKTA